MDKLKEKFYRALFLMLFVIALPFLLVTIIGGFVLCKIFEWWNDILWEIDDGDINEMWNEMIDVMAETLKTSDECILDMKIEL